MKVSILKLYLGGPPSHKATVDVRNPKTRRYSLRVSNKGGVINNG